MPTKKEAAKAERTTDETSAPAYDRGTGVEAGPVGPIGAEVILTGASGIGPNAVASPGMEQDGHLAFRRIPVPEQIGRLRTMLADHLGTRDAADAWLDSPDTGYPTCARDAVLNGKGVLVYEDLERQWGPAPAYA